jgi:hypothetical protein
MIYGSKKFNKIGPRGQCYITFSVRDLWIFALSYSVSHTDQKSLPITNTLAYYENPLFTSVKSLIRLATGHKNIVSLSITKLTADPDIRKISPEMRKCRFPGTNVKKLFCSTVEAPGGVS